MCLKNIICVSEEVNTRTLRPPVPPRKVHLFHKTLAVKTSFPFTESIFSVLMHPSYFYVKSEFKELVVVIVVVVVVYSDTCKQNNWQGHTAGTPTINQMATATGAMGTSKQCRPKEKQVSFPSLHPTSLLEHVWFVIGWHVGSLCYRIQTNLFFFWSSVVIEVRHGRRLCNRKNKSHGQICRRCF